MVRAARPVVEFGPLVAAVDDRGGRVVRIHDRFDEEQGVVRSAEGFLQVGDGLDDERLRRGVRMENLGQLCVGPGGDVVVGFGLAQVAAFDGVSAVAEPSSATGRWLAAGSLDSHLGGARTLILPGRIGPATRESA